MPALFPSLMAANQLDLEKAIHSLEAHCAGFHIDVMDNQFVPNITWGPATINAIIAACHSAPWVHLMVNHPHAWVETISLPPHSLVSFHFESLDNKNQVIKSIKEKNWRASIAINPKTDVQEIFSLLTMIDHVLIMSVHPGRTGQQFLPEVEKKITALVEHIHTNNIACTIGIDGGISEHNIAHLARAGVEHFVVGAGLFNTPDPVATLKKLQQLVAGNKQ